MGLEPTISAWKANVLPLHYTRMKTGNAASIPFDRLRKRGSFFAHRVSCLLISLRTRPATKNPAAKNAPQERFLNAASIPFDHFS